VNDHFETALEELLAIVQCQRLRMSAQQYRHADLLSKLSGSS
jgi:guanylate kinase